MSLKKTVFSCWALLLLLSCSQKQQGAPQVDPRAVGTDYSLTLLESFEITSGLRYEKFSQARLGVILHVLTLDRDKKGLTIEASFADDICPNPAPDGTNNGKKLRETLSENVARRIAEGHQVLAGINGDYYETRGGFPLSPHIEHGEPYFINNPFELSREPHFVNGFTLFEDGTISFDERKVSLAARFGEVTLPVYSVNDTIVALHPKSRAAAYQSANLYTFRFKEQPFPSMKNKVGTRAKFIVLRTPSGLKVNEGEIHCEVLRVVDGRSGTLTQAPFVTDRRDVVLQLSGSAADRFTPSVGDQMGLTVQMSIGGVVKPIAAHIGGKYLMLKDGQTGDGADDPHAPAPTPMIGATRDGRVVKLFCITGKVMFNVYPILASKLGLDNALKLDGGGSTEMWILKEGKGTIVSPSTDSRGIERSNMNYFHVCQL